MTTKTPVYSLLNGEIAGTAHLSAPYRYRQVQDWLYKKHVPGFVDMKNLPKADQELLAEVLEGATLKIIHETDSPKTGTRKFLLQTHDGYKIEAVLIPDLNERYTLCLSSQVGCSFACTFCATGTMDLKRGLKSNEIVEQFALLNRHSGYRIRNIVYMGMGEPFANQEEVFRSVKILTDLDSFALSPRRISISTSGVFSGIRRLIDEDPGCHLLISLHAADQEKRNEVMPNVKGQPLDELKKLLIEYTSKSGEELTLEYIMLKDFNDGAEDAEKLAAFASAFPSKINLIAYNHNPGLGHEASEPEAIRAFTAILERKGHNVVQRFKKGDDIAAACGQLVVNQDSEPAA